MTAFAQRRIADLNKLKELGIKTQGKFKIVNTKGNPIHEITIELNYTTAPSCHYPSKKAGLTRVVIDLPVKYPLEQPKALITTPIYHPNVYPSGLICFGTKWLATEGLDLLVKRIIKIVTFDPDILNEQSPANRDALVWYRTAIKNYPSAFPSDKFIICAETPPKPSIKWKNVSMKPTSDTVEKTTISCPGCGVSLLVPKGRTGIVSCPKCNCRFNARS